MKLTKIKKLTYLWLIVAVVCCFSLNSMETQEPVGLEALPAELVIALTPFLGKKVEHVLTGVGNLALVNTRFNELLHQNKNAVIALLNRNFNAQMIGAEFKDLLRSGDLKKAKLFMELELLKLPISDKAKLDVLKELLKTGNIDRIKQIFEHGIIVLDAPLSIGLFPPIIDILSYYRNAHERGATEALNKLTDLLTFLIKNKFWDLDKVGQFGHPDFSRALATYNVPVVEFLLDQGLDPHKPENKREIARIVQSIKFKLEHQLGEEKASKLLDTLRRRGLAD